MTSMLCGLVCVVLLSGLTALAGGQQGESGYTLVCISAYPYTFMQLEIPMV